jgi:hypothetical protein
MRRMRLFRSVAAVGAAWALAACSATPQPGSAAVASPSANGSSRVEAAWLTARVEQPAVIEAAPTDAPVFCSPCHPSVGTYIDAMVKFQGGFLALGHDQPPSHAAAWGSSDGLTWKRVMSLPAPDGSIISAAVTKKDGSVLAVGESAGRAAVWRSNDGVLWTLTALPAPEGDAKEWLTAVAASGDGFVAGGYVESATAQRTAAFWHSPDGVRWVRGSADLPAGQSQVRGIASVGGTSILAVGIAGDEQRGTGAVWRSTDAGANWQAADSPALATGRILAVVSAGSAAVAVGEREDQTGAAAWYSADGLSWISAPGPALDNFGLQMVMDSITRDGSGFVAAGWQSDAGNGSAVVWRSADGESWVHLVQDASFSGAGLACVLGSTPLMVGGTMGWPDTHAAQVWVARPG